MNSFNLDIAIEGIDRLLRLCKSEVKEKKENSWFGYCFCVECGDTRLKRTLIENLRRLQRRRMRKEARRPLITE